MRLLSEGFYSLLFAYRLLLAAAAALLTAAGAAIGEGTAAGAELDEATAAGVELDEAPAADAQVNGTAGTTAGAAEPAVPTVGPPAVDSAVVPVASSASFAHAVSC